VKRHDCPQASSCESAEWMRRTDRQRVGDMEPCGHSRRLSGAREAEDDGLAGCSSGQYAGEAEEERLVRRPV